MFCCIFLISQYSNLPFGKKLWTGSFTSGTLTVTNANKYSSFAIAVSPGVFCFGSRSYGLGGYMGYGSTNIAFAAYRYDVTESGNNLIFKTSSTSLGAVLDGNTAAITDIYGITPKST